MHHTELQRRRESLGLTQSQLADYLDVHRTTIARWETGDVAIPHSHMLRKMLDLAEDDPAVREMRQNAPKRGRPTRQASGG